MVDPTQETQTRIDSFDNVLQNEAARGEVLGLLNNEEHAEQLKGSKLEEIRPLLETPGTNVRETLTQALSEVEGGYVERHQDRATDLALAVRPHVKAPEGTMALLREVGPVFQIGKLAVPQKIMDHEGKWPDDKRREWGPKIGKMTAPDICGPLLRAMGISQEGQQVVFDSKQDEMVFNRETIAKDKPNPRWNDISQAAKILRLADSVDSMKNKKGNAKDGDRPGTLPDDQIAEQLKGQVCPNVIAAYQRHLDV